MASLCVLGKKASGSWSEPVRHTIDRASKVLAQSPDGGNVEQ